MSAPAAFRPAVASGGGVFSYGGAPALGSLAGQSLSAPIEGLAATPAGSGYWLVGADGGVFTFGAAGFFGSTGAQSLNAPIVGMASTADGNGYWLGAADGGIFAFGDAPFLGSMGGQPLNQPIVGMAATPDGKGYWLVARDGGMFAFGDAPFLGSMAGQPLDAPVVGVAATGDGGGYWLAGADGGVFAFGDAPYAGSPAGQALSLPIVGIARGGSGYLLTEGGGSDNPFTPQLDQYLAKLPQVTTSAVEDLNTGQVYTYNPGPQLVLASTFKVEILGTLLAEAQEQGRGLTAWEQSKAAPMIEISTNTAAQALFVHVGGAPAIQAWDDSIGMVATTVYANWAVATTTPTDQLTLLDTFVVPNGHLDDASRAYGLSLLGNVEPSQVFGLSPGPPPGGIRAAKTGRIPALGARNTIGWIDADGRDYVVATFCQYEPSDQSGEAAMEAVAAAAWATLDP